MKIVAVIPARYASRRLPGKVLLQETGRPLVIHVYERVREAGRIDEVWIATDDGRVVEVCESFGARVLMTSDRHTCGTDRMAEAARLVSGDVFINVQGDEPDLPADVLDRLVESLCANREPVATLACPLSAALMDNPDVVKVVQDRQGRALYFSRAPIPWRRSDSEEKLRALRHIGSYAFRRETLLQYCEWEQTPLERLEQLEQLRLLEHGIPVRIALVESLPPGIDTREQYDAFVQRTGHQPCPSTSS